MTHATDRRAEILPSTYVGNGRGEYVMHVRVRDPQTNDALWSSWNYAGIDVQWGSGPYDWVPFSGKTLGTWKNNTGISREYTVEFWAERSYAGADLRWSVDSTINGGGSNWSVPCFPLDPLELIATNPAIKNSCVCYVPAADPVNTRTGAFYEDFVDIAAIPGRGPSLSVTRSYNTARSTLSGPFGPGWTHNLGLSVTGPDASGIVRVIQENGTAAIFRPDGAGGWESPSRTDAALEELPNSTGWRFIRGDREIFEFTPTGLLSSIADLNGYELSLTYTDGLLASVTDSAGRSVTYTWSGTGDAARIVQVTDPSSPARTVSYGYDPSGRLISVTDVAGGVWRYGYDTADRIVTVTKPRQGELPGSPSTTNVYDTSGRVISQTDEAGQTTTFDYTSEPDATIVTDPAGHQTRYGYDNLGLVTSVTRGYGTTASTWTYVHEIETLGVTKTTDPNGHTTTVTFDGDGDRLSVTDPLGRTTSWTYNDLDQILTVTDRTGVVTTNTYDAAGNLLSVSRPLLDGGGTAVDTATTTMVYGDSSHPGDVTATIDPLGRTTTFTYDTAGNVVSTTTPASDAAPDGAVTTTAYNEIGWPTSTVTPRGNLPGANPADFTTTYVRNAFGDIVSTTAPDGATSTATYDANRNVVTSTDPKGNTTETVYDVLDRPVSVVRADGTNTHTAYTAAGMVASTTDAAGNSTTYTYDAQDRRVEVTDPLARTTTFTYDPAGNLLSKTAPDGTLTEYRYDAANQLTGIDYPSPRNPDVSYTYDQLGRKTRRYDDTGTATWTYDSLGRLTAETANGVTTSYHYDLAGQITAIDYPNDAGTIARGYDDAGQLTSITDWHQRTFTFDYDAAGNLIGQYTPNGTTTTIDVDTAGAVANIAHAGADGISGDFARFEYTRDANRQVTATVSTGVPTEPSSFSYDALNQLTATTIGTTSASYQYDPADNVTRLLDQTAQHFDPANQLQSTTSPITSVSSTSLTDQASTTMVVPFSGTAGDQVLLWVTTPATESVAATPSGYTALGTWTQGNTKAHLYRHAISSSTDQSVTIDFTGLTGTYTKSATAVVYRGVDPTAPIDDLQAATTTGTSVTLPSVTGSLDNTSEVIFAGTHTPDLTTEPGTWTVTDATPRAAAEPPIGVASAVFDQDQLDAGPTSPWLAENTVGGDLIGVAVALKPARVTYNYDQRGNRITKTSPADTTTYTYDAADRLTAIDDTIAYSYNGDGLRVSKTVDDTTTDFVWSTNATMPLLLAENDTYYVYGPGNQVLEAIDPTPAIEYLGGMNLSITDTPTAAVPVPAVNKRDLIILATVIPTDQTATTPDGYTLLDTTISGNTKTIAWTRIATDSEPTTVNVDYSTGVYDKAIGIAAWRHVDPDNPIETTTSTTATGTDTITTGTGTASNQWGNQAILIAGITSNANHYGTSGWTEPADMTARPTGINASNTELLFADAAVSNGTVGSYTTTNINTGDLTATLVVLNHARPPGRYYHADQLGSIRATTNEYAEITTTRSYDPYGTRPQRHHQRTQPERHRHNRQRRRRHDHPRR